MAADPPTSIEATAEWFRKRFQPEAALGVRAVFALEITGPGGGTLWTRVDDGRLELSLDAAPGGAAPDVRLRLSADDWYDVAAGRENAELLAMVGRIEIDGDVSLAMKLRSLFRLSA